MVFCPRPTHSVVEVSQFVLTAMKVPPLMDAGQTQTWLLHNGIWVKTGFRVSAVFPGMTEMKMGIDALPAALAVVVSPAATASAVLLPGLCSGPAPVGVWQGPPCFQDLLFDQGAAAPPAATLAALPNETESMGNLLKDGMFADPGLPCWWRSAKDKRGFLDSGACETVSKGYKLNDGMVAVPWRAAKRFGDLDTGRQFMCQGDFLDEVASLSVLPGPLVPCETESKGYMLSVGQLPVPGLAQCWWAVAVKAAAATMCDDHQVDSSSSAAAICSRTEASILGKCPTDDGKEKMIQFFVNKGNGSEVVRCCSHAIVSHTLDYGSEGYAVCGTRILRPGDSFLQNGVESGMTVRLLFRLRGGSGGNNVDIPGQWQCSFCQATRCWPTRKQCYRCGTPRVIPTSDGPTRGPLGRAPPPARAKEPPTRSSGPAPQTVPPRNIGKAPPPQRSPPGAGVGPFADENGNKDDGNNLVQALSLLQKIMTPEDFAKYQLLVSPKPKPKPEKTREQELADKVRNLERFKSQEASHKGMIDKYELDLQRQRNMLRAVVEQIRQVEDEIKDLRVLVAKEKSDSSDGDNASVRTAPASQVDSPSGVGDIGLVVNPSPPMPVHPGPFESCDEDMLCSSSEAEDEREVRRNGIWERRRSGVIKKGRLLKVKPKAKPNKTIIIEEEGESPPPGPPPQHGKHLAEVLASLSQEGLREVLTHCTPSFLQTVSSFGASGSTTLFG